MKTYKVIFTAFATMVLGVLIFVACSQENPNYGVENPKLNFREANEVEAQMAEILLGKYDIRMNILENDEYEFERNDGRKFVIKTIDSKVFLTGSAVNNESYVFEQLSKEQIDNLDSESEYLFASNTLKSEFISSVNDVSNLSPEQQVSVNPCSEHPSNETFKECFCKRMERFL